MAIEIPKYIIFPFLFTTIIYWMCGLNDKPEKFFLCCVVCILVANNAVALGKSYLTNILLHFLTIKNN